jgi:hypothetical protein
MNKMITAEDEAYILTHAYVPEHIVSLMVILSKGEPFLIEDHLIFTKDNWLIFVGYPLDGIFSQERCEKVVKQVLEKFRPESLRFIGPEIPLFLSDSCTERQTDRYYRFDIEQTRVKNSLRRVAEKASQQLDVERSYVLSKEHKTLISELSKREKLRPRVKELYHAMPDYVSHSSSACVLNAWSKEGRLSAFYILELGAKKFNTYLIGTHSRKNYVPHASDLLFFKMVELTREQGKNEINLGLGVNEGIRRFKEKWGGVPFLNYEECEYCPEGIKMISMVRTLEGKL